MHKYRLCAKAMPARQVLRLATMGGVNVLDLKDEIGSLEVGKKADVIILDDGGLLTSPFRDYVQDDPLKLIVSAYQSSSVQTSIIDGKIVMENRQLLIMDEQEILQAAQQAWRKISR